MNAPWNNEDLRRAFDADFDALVAFASRSKARVGYAFLRADGQVDLGRPLDARISARMTHVFALAQMRGIEGASHLVSHGLAALTGPLRAANGSWYSEVVPTSETSAIPVPRSVLSQRAQAAMIGAAAAALMAGHSEAADLLAKQAGDPAGCGARGHPARLGDEHPPGRGLVLGERNHDSGLQQRRLTRARGSGHHRAAARPRRRRDIAQRARDRQLRRVANKFFEGGHGSIFHKRVILLTGFHCAELPFFRSISTSYPASASATHASIWSSLTASTCTVCLFIHTG